MDVFKRKIYDELLKWKDESRGKTALLIEGARRVGKTTVVKEFANNEYRSSVIIDFLRPRPGTIETFEHYYSDIPLLLSSLAILYNSNLKERDTLFVFDEVQYYPRARQLIKYLVEDGRFDFIETGSLISIKKNVENIQIPSEEERIRMFPMDFEEWLWANGDSESASFIRNHFDNREPLAEPLHRSIMEKYKTYMLIGGMPQSVSAFLESRDFSRSEKSKRLILDLYRQDILKIPDGYATKSLQLFNRIPSMLSGHSKVFRPGSVDGGTRSRDFEDGITWLDEARIINPCYLTTDPNITLNLNTGDRFKCYFIDTGLLMTLAFEEGITTREDVHTSFIKGRLNINQGMMFENMVAQELVVKHPTLRFSEFYDKMDDKHLHEVDFVLPSGKSIVPVEVKSGVSSRHRSLDIFMDRYRDRISEAYVIHTKNLKVDRDLVYIPIYMTMFL